MSNETVIRLAREAGMAVSPLSDEYCDAVDLPRGTVSRCNDVGLPELRAFAELVKAEFLERTGQYITNDASREAAWGEAVAAEREACAKVCDHYATALDGGDNHYLRSAECRQAAARIRARAEL